MRISIAALVVLVGCGVPGRTDDGTTDEVSDDIGEDTTTDAVPGDVSAVAFTQAVGGAMFVNPDAFPTIPVRVRIEGTASAVSVALDGAAVDAVAEGDEWVAQVPVGALPAGEHALVATADGVTAMATLVVGREGIQWTSIATNGNAGTPRLHTRDGRLYLTWTDGSRGPRTAWVQEIDGGGRAVGPRTALVAGDEDVLYARAALGAAGMGVLYQTRGGPYVNRFVRVGLDGALQGEVVPLDGDRYGSYGGDIVWTGTDFEVAWRTNNGAGTSSVHWMRVEEATGAVTGPIIAAAAGNDDPDGGFDPITPLSVQPGLVAFMRYRYDAALDFSIKRCQVATIDNAAASIELAAIGSGWSWDEDCRVVDGGTGPLVLRAGSSLTDESTSPPVELFATRSPLAGNRGNGTMAVSAPDQRGEPNVVPTAGLPVMVWSDARSYAEDITTGQIELYAAPLAESLVAGAPIRFAHTRLINSTAEPRGVAAGANAIVTWIDERHGGSIVNPQPEVYIETIWQ